MKLLIPVDDSDDSRHAIELAMRLAQEVGTAEVILLNVRNAPEY